MTRTVHGTVHGRMIELDEDLGVVEGQKVEVQVTVLKANQRLPGPPPGWRPGNPQSFAGILSDLCTEDDDRILDEIYQDRKRETQREIPE
jgi:hypothetical protein